MTFYERNTYKLALQKEQQMRIIGLISGTSMDAIDAALVDVECEGTTLHLAVRAFVMLPLSEELSEKHQEAKRRSIKRVIAR